MPELYDVSVSPDGTRFATITGVTHPSNGKRHEVTVWDAATGNRLRRLDAQFTFSNQTGAGGGVCWSPDGLGLASFTSSEAVMVWDTSTDMIDGVHMQIPLEESDKDCDVPQAQVTLPAVAWSPCGGTLAVGTKTGILCAFDYRFSKTIEHISEHPSAVSCVAWSPESETIAAGSREGNVYMVDVDTRMHRHLHVPGAARKPRAQLGASNSWEGDAVRSVAFSPDGQVLATGSSNCTAKLWDVATGKLLHVLEGHSSKVGSVAWCNDGGVLASGSFDGTVRLWDSATGALLHVLGEGGGAIQYVAWSPDGRTIAANSYNATVRVWHSSTGELVHGITDTSHSDDERKRSDSDIEQAIKSPAGGVHFDEYTSMHPQPGGRHHYAPAFAWSPCGKDIFSTTDDNCVKIHAVT